MLTPCQKMTDRDKHVRCLLRERKRGGFCCTAEFNQVIQKTLRHNSLPKSRLLTCARLCC